MTDLIRWDPFSDLDSLTKAFFGRGSAFDGRSVPTADVYVNKDKELVGEFHLPGYNENDIEIDVHEGVLEVRGERKSKEESRDKKDRKYVVKESSSSFYRSIALPKQADESKIDAHFENGLLTVRVPFKELPKPKRIAIKKKN